jgi:large subunit ribosomal protein L24
MKLHKGDTVIVTGGKDKGSKGKIDRIFKEENAVLVAGVNMYKRHLKRRDEKNPGGIVDLPRPLSIGKVALLCPKCKQPTRIGYEITAKEKKRVCRKCKQTI